MILQQSGNLEKQDRQVLELKYSKHPFCHMSDIDIVEDVVKLIKRIKVVTGWPIPELQEDRIILYQELAAHFKESWPTLNSDEIAFAVRFYGTSVENWGKDINLNLIDRCIASYYAKRKDLSKVEESKTPDPQPKPQTELPKEVLCEYRYRYFLSKGSITLTLIPDEIYDALVGHYIEAGLYEDFIEEAKKEAMEFKTILPIAFEDKVVMVAKKLAVRYVFCEAAKNGFTHLFEIVKE